MYNVAQSETDRHLVVVLVLVVTPLLRRWMCTVDANVTED